MSVVFFSVVVALEVSALVVREQRPWPGGRVTHLGAQLVVPAGWRIERIPARNFPVVCDTFGAPPTVWLFEDQFEADCLLRSPDMGVVEFRTGPDRGVIVMPVGSVEWEEWMVRGTGTTVTVNGIRAFSERLVDPSGAHVQVVIFDELGLHVRASLGRDGRSPDVEGMLASISAAPTR